MIKDDGTVIHFNNPKAQASLSANTFAITGHGENKQITEMLPGILSQLGPDGLTHLKRLASSVAGSGVSKAAIEEDDEVPDLVENFDEASKEEVIIKIIEIFSFLCIKFELTHVSTFICKVASKKDADEALSIEDKKKASTKSTDESKNAPIAKQEA